MELNTDFQINGKWINKRNGNIINVSNYVSDGNETLVMSSIGPIVMEEFMNNYVQAEDQNIDDTPIIPESGNVKASDTIFNQEYTFDDDLVITNDNSSTIDISTKTKHKIKINNEEIISRLFDNIENKPIIDVNILWDNFPKNEISTLINFLNVEIEDIGAYIYKNMFTDDNIIDNITNILSQKLHNDS